MFQLLHRFAYGHGVDSKGFGQLLHTGHCSREGAILDLSSQVPRELFTSGEAAKRFH